MKNLDDTITEKDLVYRLNPDGTAVVVHDMGMVFGGREIRIPEMVRGCPVVEIADGVFNHHEGISRLFVPVTVTKIGIDTLPRCGWRETIIGYQEEYGHYRRGSFPVYGKAPTPVVWVIPGSYAEQYCKERNFEYVSTDHYPVDGK